MVCKTHHGGYTRNGETEMKILAIIMLVLTAALVPPATVQAKPTGETYADYTMMFQRTGGQHWNATSNTVSGQWAWTPQSATSSYVTWGHPSTWPAGTVERFSRDGDWIRLDGWHDSQVYELRTSVEWMANADCVTGRVALTPGGPQRYAKWNVDSQPYCLFSLGTIRQVSTGKLISFAHQQIWSQETCTNAYLGSRSCLKQVERWWDDNGTPWTEKVTRTQWIGKGVGLAYKIDSKGTKLDLRYAWNW